MFSHQFLFFYSTVVVEQTKSCCSLFVRFCEAIVCWQPCAACRVRMHAVERSVGDDCGDADDLNYQHTAGVPESGTKQTMRRCQPQCVEATQCCSSYPM
jgi:hypothetical protein